MIGRSEEMRTTARKWNSRASAGSAVDLRAMAVVTFTTDFGTRDGYAAAMKGVVLSLASDTVLVDVTHDIDPQNVLGGAFALAQAAPRFPQGTVHIAVVDPGVGARRGEIIVEANGQFFVGPDNGLLALAAARPRRCFRIENALFRAENPSPTFHGRDIFAVAAGQLARGHAASEAGPRIDDIQESQLVDSGVLEQQGCGKVNYIDHFGNLFTSFSGGSTSGQWQLVCMGQAFDVTGGRTFSDVASGRLVLYPGSSGWLEIAERDGFAASAVQASVGASIELRRLS